MGFLDSLKSMFAGQPVADDYWVYVRCNRCHEAIKTRIDLRNDLSETDGGDFVVNKTLVGSRLCFERIEVKLYFNRSRQLIDQEIERGQFISAQDYEADGQ
jgi:hypothetical protein